MAKKKAASTTQDLVKSYINKLEKAQGEKVTKMTFDAQFAAGRHLKIEFEKSKMEAMWIDVEELDSQDAWDLFRGGELILCKEAERPRSREFWDMFRAGEVEVSGDNPSIEGSVKKKTGSLITDEVFILLRDFERNVGDKKLRKFLKRILK
jgi:hypothetical protein